MRRATSGWARLDDAQLATIDLTKQLRSNAKREDSRIEGEPEVRVLNPGFAVLNWEDARPNQPANFDGWCFIIVSADLTWQGAEQARCPICEEPVKNYTSAPNPSGRQWASWPVQSEIPDWCELRPCGHTVRGEQIELKAHTEQGFKVHER
jgi:hypothetical protein